MDNCSSDVASHTLIRTALLLPSIDLHILAFLSASKSSRDDRKPTFGLPNWSDTNPAVQLQKIARGLKFQIYIEEELQYPCGENKGTCKMLVFS